MTARHILIAMQDFARGGTERIAVGLAKDWVEMGREVTILCGSTEGGLRDTVDPRVTVTALGVRRGLLSRFRLARRMGARLADARPDVIFLPGNFHLLLAPGLRRAGSHARIALKISNPPVPDAPFAKTIFRHFARGVDGFAAMNSGLAREVAALMPGKAVVTLHDPVYRDRSDAPPVRRDGVRNIVWIGRLEPQKDVGLALRTMAAMEGAHLTILGDGALRGDIERWIAAMKLENKVTLAGYVPHIAPYLAGADALLITSRYEGGPAVAVEALAAGVPVVSTDCSHLLRDLIRIPQAGRIVPSRDPAALASALAVPGPCPPRDMLAGLVADFDPVLCARAYLDWFDALVRA
ncbi:MAG TPA: glycosyltransferase [Rhizomicrobium sp.]